MIDIREQAAEHGLKPEEYVMMYGDVALVRIKNLAVEEVAQIIRHFELKADKHRRLGERLVNACEGMDNAKQIIKELESRKEEERKIKLAQVKKRGRGRPKKTQEDKMKQYVKQIAAEYDPDIPF